MEVLIPNSFKATSSPFSDMLLNPQQALRAAQMFKNILVKSFAHEEATMGKAFRQRIQTGAEMKHRADILARWFRVLRGDLGYSMAKIENELGNALRSELDGELYTPASAHGSYGVTEGETQ